MCPLANKHHLGTSPGQQSCGSCASTNDQRPCIQCSIRGRLQRTDLPATWTSPGDHASSHSKSMDRHEGPNNTDLPPTPPAQPTSSGAANPPQHQASPEPRPSALPAHAATDHHSQDSVTGASARLDDLPSSECFMIGERNTLYGQVVHAVVSCTPDYPVCKWDTAAIFAKGSGSGGHQTFAETALSARFYSDTFCRTCYDKLPADKRKVVAEVFRALSRTRALWQRYPAAAPSGSAPIEAYHHSRFSALTRL